MEGGGTRRRIDASRGEHEGRRTRGYPRVRRGSAGDDAAGTRVSHPPNIHFFLLGTILSLSYLVPSVARRRPRRPSVAASHSASNAMSARCASRRLLRGASGTQVAWATTRADTARAPVVVGDAPGRCGLGAAPLALAHLAPHPTRGFSANEPKDGDAARADATPNPNPDAAPRERESGEHPAADDRPPGRAPAPEGTSGPARPTIGTTAVLRPSVWSLPVVFFRAVRTALWIRPWIVRTFDPHFDGEEILRGAAAAHPVVLAAFAGNDMRLLRDACGDAAFDAFRDARTEYQRANTDLSVRVRATTTGADVDDDVDPTAGAILVDAGVYAEGDDEEAAARAIAGVALAQTRGGKDGSGFDLGETIRLRLSATVRFQLVEEWTLVDTVTGERGVTTDARGHEWTFTRELPRRWPSAAPLDTPWRLDTIE